MNSLTIECLDKLGIALKRFGTYSYDDKGPQEVINVNELATKIKKLDPAEAIAVLLEINTSKKYEGRGSYLASTLICNLQDWDELFQQEDINKIDW